MKDIKYAEIDRRTLKAFNGNISEILKRKCYILRDNNFIKNAFQFGHGTMKDFKRYMKDNRIYCIWINLRTGREVK